MHSPMSHKNRRVDAAPAFFDRLESRLLLSGTPKATPEPTVVGPVVPAAIAHSLTHPVTRGATPASVLTKPIRQTLLDGMAGLPSATKTSLQSKLTSNDLAGFDTTLLSYMTTRTNAHFR